MVMLFWFLQNFPFPSHQLATARDEIIVLMREQLEAENTRANNLRERALGPVENTHTRRRVPTMPGTPKSTHYSDDEEDAESLRTPRKYSSTHEFLSPKSPRASHSPHIKRTQDDEDEQIEFRQRTSHLLTPQFERKRSKVEPPRGCFTP